VPKMDIAKAMVRTKGVYPDPWRAITEGREKAALGDVVGLTQFGVNLTRLKSGAASALRHWHEAEDEFARGRDHADRGRRGDSCNRETLRGSRLASSTVIISSTSAVYLEVGGRAKLERAYYPDVDLVYDRDQSGFRFSRRSGQPYPNSGG
jgi:uncharacterized cupin superfamily protein